MENMLKEITTRRSIRKYDGKPINDESISLILESARLAPSGSNTQPWHFIVVKSEEMRKKLTEAAYDQNWMLTAPVHIVCVADVRSRISAEIPAQLDENSSQPELKQIIRDTAIAVEHMVLTAEHLKLGTCWVAKFTQDRIRPVLNIPADKYVLCILTVGYPEEHPAPRPRKKAEEMIHYEVW